MIENFDNMLSTSLQLEEPWYVTGASFDPEKQQMNIWVKVRDRAVFACPRCGTQAKRYGYEPYERSWRHADCLFFPCYVQCQRPKVLCEKCGVQQVNAPFERQNSRFTLMFEGYAMMILADVPRRQASQLLRCNEKSLASILSYWVNRAADKGLCINYLYRMRRMNSPVGGAPQIFDLSRAIPGDAGDNFAKGKVTIRRRREACRGTLTDGGAKPKVSRSGALRQTGLAESEIQTSHRQRSNGGFRQAECMNNLCTVPMQRGAVSFRHSAPGALPSPSENPPRRPAFWRGRAAGRRGGRWA